MEGHTHAKVATGGKVQRTRGRTNVVVCLHLGPDNDGGRITEMLESVANERFNLKHHAADIRLALQIQDGRAMAADAGSDGKCSTSSRRQVIRVLESL